MTNSREQQLIGRLVELEAENQTLRAHMAELEQEMSKLLAAPTSPPKTAATVPRFVKPKRQKRRRKKPGHAGSYRRRPTDSPAPRKELPFEETTYGHFCLSVLCGKVCAFV